MGRNLILLLIVSLFTCPVWAGDDLPPIYIESLTSMEFILVRGGCFEMGAHSSTSSPPLCVDDFYIGMHEVTQEEWARVMGTNPSIFKNPAHPVDSVSFRDAEAFIQKLFETTGLRYSLPTEAQWEFAARGLGAVDESDGSQTPEEISETTWYWKNSPNGTHPVGTKRPNSLGLFDMTGNVWEWCARAPNRGNPSAGAPMAARGGGWASSPGTSTVFSRSTFPPSAKMDCLGFRLSYKRK